MSKIKTTYYQERLPRVMREQDVQRLSQINILSKDEVENFWGIKTPGKGRNMFPQDVIDEILRSKEDLSNFCIIYLSGASFNQMRNAKKLFFNSRELILTKDRFDEQGISGYYLIKISDDKIQNKTPEIQRDIINEKWRGLHLLEAIEAIVLIKTLLKKDSYQDQWHISVGPKKDGRDGYKQYVHLIKISSKNRKRITLLSREDIKIKMETNSIITRKLRP